MKAEIYQLRDDIEQRHDKMFASLKEVNAIGGVKANDYDFIYETDASGETTTDVLESVYERFNLFHPADYRGRSLSMSDIVVLNENGVRNAYYCDTVGFTNLPDFTIEKPISLLSSGIKIDDQAGTWRTIDQAEIDGKSYFLLENEQFGGDAASLVVDSSGQVMLSSSEDRFNDSLQSQVAAVSAARLAAERTTATQVARDNPLMNAEMDEEGNYNMIDGVPNNGFGDKKKAAVKEAASESKSSVLEKLEHYKEVVGVGSDRNDAMDRSL